MMDGIEEESEAVEEILENGLAFVKGLKTIANEDREHKNQRETGNVHTTL